MQEQRSNTKVFFDAVEDAGALYEQYIEISRITDIAILADASGDTYGVDTDVHSSEFQLVI